MQTRSFFDLLKQVDILEYKYAEHCLRIVYLLDDEQKELDFKGIRLDAALVSSGLIDKVTAFMYVIDERMVYIDEYFELLFRQYEANHLIASYHAYESLKNNMDKATEEARVKYDQLFKSLNK